MGKVSIRLAGKALKALPASLIENLTRDMIAGIDKKDRSRHIGMHR